MTDAHAAQAGVRGEDDVSDVAGLSLRFLGDMEVARDGVRLHLPPSRKTRALLAYLALTGRPHRRERLCALLWDVADDPRGALRWSLSRLRSVVDDGAGPRIVAERDRVAFEPRGAYVDVDALRRRAAVGFARASLEDLLGVEASFRGELLEGLELADFEDFRAWCVAERQEICRLHRSLLRTIVDRLAERPQQALAYARSLVALDPFDQDARALLGRLLAQGDRPNEAGRRHPEPTGAPVHQPRSEPIAASGAVSLVGRDAEREWLLSALEVIAREGGERVLLIRGEPGIGKSRLLAELCTGARARGSTVLHGRAFEAEAGRPYGPWLDVLRGLPAASLGGLAAELAPLLPELGEGHPQASRDRLFAAVVDVLAGSARHGAPLVLALDDVQWLDPDSAELLHYAARSNRTRPFLLALAARQGALDDNEAAARAIRGLRRLDVLEERLLGPLDEAATAALVAVVAPAADGARVYAQCAGHPLFAIEVARALASGEERLPGSLAGLVRQRVERLAPEAVEVLRWASVLGEGFDVERLRTLCGLELERLLAGLESLERDGLLRSAPGGGGGSVFAHEVVRRAVYGEISLQRRRLMHLRVARQLEPLCAANDLFAADLARHAAQADEPGLAVRACIAAGRRSLRLFASEDALELARQGRRHAESLAEPERTQRLLELQQLELGARRPADPATVAAEIEQLAESALDQGSPEHARLGYHLLAWLHWEEGLWSEARRDTLRSELVSRAGDEREQVVAMAETARCLAMIERDLPQAEALLHEARARCVRTGVRPAAIADGTGMLRLHEGRLAEAAELFEQARQQARREGDRMAEFQALEHLVGVHQQRGAWDAAWRHCDELVALGEKLRGGSEAPSARAAFALTRCARGDARAGEALDAALQELRLVDAKQRLAFTLTRAAELALERGDAVLARQQAEEALRLSDLLGRPSEALLAGAALARAGLALGDAESARRVVEELGLARRRRPRRAVAFSKLWRASSNGRPRRSTVRASVRRKARDEGRGREDVPGAGGVRQHPGARGQRCEVPLRPRDPLPDELLFPGPAADDLPLRRPRRRIGAHRPAPGRRPVRDSLASGRGASRSPRRFPCRRPGARRAPAARRAGRGRRASRRAAACLVPRAVRLPSRREPSLGGRPADDLPLRGPRCRVGARGPAPGSNAVRPRVGGHDPWRSAGMS